MSADLFNNFGNMPLLGSQKMEMALEFLTVMDSRTFREDVIRRFDLVRHFRIYEPDSAKAMDKALKKYNDKLFRAALEQQTNTITVSVFTRDRLLSKNIAEYILASLESRIRNSSKVKSSITRQFIEKRTLDVKAAIDSLLVKNRRFEANGKAVALDEQTKKVFELYSDLVSQMMLNDVELEVARRSYGPETPKVVELESKSRQLRQQIADFEKDKGGSMPKYILNLQKLPDINLEYYRNQVDLNVLNKVYDYIYPMLEAARLEEQKDMPAMDVMDRPSLAGLHAYPKRLLLIICITFAALLLSCLLSVMDEFMSDGQKAFLRQIGNELHGSKK